MTTWKNRHLLTILLALASLASACAPSVGIYKSKCSNTAYDSTTGTSVSTSVSYETSLEFGLSDMNSSLTMFNGTTCGTKLITFKTKNTFAMGGPSAVSGANNLDVTLKSITITPHTNEMASIYRIAQLCGISSWAAETETDITDKNCGNAGIKNKTGDKSYNIVKKSTADGVETLAFGKTTTEYDGTTDTRRPKELYEDYLFYKQ